jgi:lysozyme family protein
MADFLIAFEKVFKNEGFYGNIPGDAGGETIWGIARNMNPNWEGWAIVDKYRGDKRFPGILKENPTLIKLKLSFYRKTFWDKIRGDQILFQPIASEIVDDAVNTGVRPAIKKLQRTLALIDTGIMDDATLEKLNERYA